MRDIAPHNTFDNVKGMATDRVKEMPESKTKKLKEALEHGLGDLTTNDEMVISPDAQNRHCAGYA